MESSSEDVVDIIKSRYKKIEETLSLLNEFIESDPQILEDKIKNFGFRGLSLSLFQGLLDLSNALLISRDATPTSYKDIFMYLIEYKVVDSQYKDLLEKIIELRNVLLFGHKQIDSTKLLLFLKNHLSEIREIFHSIFKLLGEL